MLKMFFSTTYKLLSAVGAALIEAAISTGRLILFFFSILWQSLRCPLYIRQVRQHILSMGYCSLPLIGLTSLFTGMVLALQSYTSFGRFNVDQALPEIVALSFIRELGPVLNGLMLSGRLGASIAAEIATMRVTEQIDALITLSTNPIRYLVVPRILATLCVLPCLTIIADVIGILGGYGVGVYQCHLNPSLYLSETMRAVQWTDIHAGLIKSLVFGAIIGFVGCYQGYYSSKGAMGVGLSTTQAVVISSITILASNYVLTSFLFS